MSFFKCNSIVSTFLMSRRSIFVQNFIFHESECLRGIAPQTKIEHVFVHFLNPLTPRAFFFFFFLRIQDF